MAPPIKPLVDAKTARLCLDYFKTHSPIKKEELRKIIRRDRAVVRRYIELWRTGGLNKYDPDLNPLVDGYWTFIKAPSKAQLMAGR